MNTIDLRPASPAGSVILFGSVDNFSKPILSKRAHLDLPAVLVFLTMLSGVVAFGPAGLLLGPLFVRTAMEALAIAREERWVEPREGSPLAERRQPNRESPFLVAAPTRGSPG